MVQDQHGLKSQIRHWENCCLASISRKLIFVFLTSLKCISQIQSKGPLLFNLNGKKIRLLAPDTWLKLAA